MTSSRKEDIWVFIKMSLWMDWGLTYIVWFCVQWTLTDEVKHLSVQTGSYFPGNAMNCKEMSAYCNKNTYEQMKGIYKWEATKRMDIILYGPRSYSISLSIHHTPMHSLPHSHIVPHLSNYYDRLCMYHVYKYKYGVRAWMWNAWVARPHAYIRILYILTNQNVGPTKHYTFIHFRNKNACNK